MNRVVAEALNSIFDVFAEPEVNDVVMEIRLVEQLQAFTPLLKSHLKAQKRSMARDLYGRLDEAKLNLGRFIKYKLAQF